MKSNNTLERSFILKKCDSFHACKEGCFHIDKSMTVVPPTISKIRQKPYYNFNRQKIRQKSTLLHNKIFY